MKSFNQFKESIIDIPRRTYAPGVFDDEDTDNPKIKDSVLRMITKQFQEFETEYPILKYSLIGSILTKRYRNDADLDINVLFDVPEDEQEERREQYSKLLRDINGKFVPGTAHPVNYYVITDPKVLENNNRKADGIFSIKDNDWIKKPDEDTFEPEKYEAEFQKKVQELDIIKGELKRDIVDYQELKQLTNNDVLNLQELVNAKLEEIEDSIRRLKEIGDKLTNDRRDIFSREMTPDEIREFGKQNKLPKNVIYKMLEKYHYMKFYKYLKKILEDDKITDKEIDDLSINEAPEYSKGTLALAFGRFNPPTIGHEKLLRKVAQTPGDFKHVYLSKSQDSTKNPLTPTQKIKYMRDMFPQHRTMFRIPSSNMILDIATQIYKDGYTNINFVAGSDRVQEFKTILNKYNNVKSRHGFYNFKNIRVISAGERDPDAEGATGMSASKMRKAVAQGDMKSFEKGLPRGFRGEKDLFRDVAKGMRVDWKKALAANYGMRNHYFGYQYKPVASLEDFDKKQLRDLYIREVIFNIGDKVHYVTEDVYGKIVRRSTNYIVLEDENDNLHKAWIYDCVPESADKEVAVREFNLDVDYGFEAVSEGDMKEKKKLAQDPDVRKEPGTQPKKYYKTLSKDVKQKRADFFKKQDTSDTSPGSYKAAPGDDKAKTKTSKHTKKFKQMYGEAKGEFHLFDNKKDAEKKAKEIGGKVIDGTSFRAGYYAVYKGKPVKESNEAKGDYVISVKGKEMFRSKSDKDARSAFHKLVNKHGLNDVKAVRESYEIGADYANHTKEMTPGETPDEKPVDSKLRTPENPQNKDVKKDKYKMKTFKEYAEDDKYSHLDEELEITEAEYQGKKVKLNDPIRGGSKKFYVYVKNNKGNVVKVSFGDTTGLSIKRDDPERRKNFRARHNCDTAKDKTTARYWSCRMWTARTKVSDLD